MYPAKSKPTEDIDVTPDEIKKPPIHGFAENNEIPPIIEAVASIPLKIFSKTFHFARSS